MLATMLRCPLALLHSVRAPAVAARCARRLSSRHNELLLPFNRHRKIENRTRRCLAYELRLGRASVYGYVPPARTAYARMAGLAAGDETLSVGVADADAVRHCLWRPPSAVYHGGPVWDVYRKKLRHVMGTRWGEGRPDEFTLRVPRTDGHKQQRGEEHGDTVDAGDTALSVEHSADVAQSYWYNLVPAEPPDVAPFDPQVTPYTVHFLQVQRLKAKGQRGGRRIKRREPCFQVTAVSWNMTETRAACHLQYDHFDVHTYVEPGACGVVSLRPAPTHRAVPPFDRDQPWHWALRCAATDDDDGDGDEQLAHDDPSHAFHSRNGRGVQLVPAVGHYWIWLPFE